MAHDYADLHNPDELDDHELRELVREQLGQHPALDVDLITVLAAEGKVTLSGRVGTEDERRVAEHVLTDVLGISNYANDLVVDTISRAESPMDIDDHLADEERRSGALLGDVPQSYTDESQHLDGEQPDDLAGSADYNKVMEEGMTWNPPDVPTPEGLGGSADAEPGDSGERH